MRYVSLQMSSNEHCASIIFINYSNFSLLNAIELTNVEVRVFGGGGDIVIELDYEENVLNHLWGCLIGTINHDGIDIHEIKREAPLCIRGVVPCKHLLLRYDLWLHRR